jgi:lysozyme family protein
MFSNDFITAFMLSMQTEVGPWFNANDPATQQGLIDTAQHRQACGYVNVAGDSGGVTKFGIAQTQNPSVNVSSLTLAGAQNIYFSQYWTPAHCVNIPTPLSAIHFDSAVNMGVGTAAKLLQTALGVTADGNIGPQTLGAVAACTDIPGLCSLYLNARQARYNLIVTNNPSQAQFLQGWTNRVNALQAWVTSQTSQ